MVYSLSSFHHLFIHVLTEIKRIQRYAGKSCVLVCSSIHLCSYGLFSQTKKYKLNLLPSLCFLPVDVTLDSDTANSVLVVSDDGKQVRYGGLPQKLPDNPERFDPLLGVLGKEGYSSGAFYFEVSFISLL